MSDDLLKKIVTIVVDKLDVEENKVTVDAQFIDDLGADSLDTVELIMEIEEQFEIDIPDEEAEKIQSVKDALDYIKRISEIEK